MADILNQEEIDRLLNATGFDAPTESSGMSPEDVEAMERLVRVFFASANAALGTLLARPASVTEGLGQVVDIEALDSGSSVLLQFPFRSGFGGNLFFLLRRADAAPLADMILGGEGEPKEVLEEADLDALKEAMTQVAGSGAPTLSATLGVEVGFDPPQIKLVEQSTLENDMGLTEAYLGTGTIQVDGVLDAPLRILLSVPLAQEMARAEGDADPSDKPSSAPATAYAAPATTPRAAAPSASAAAVPPDIRNIDLILDIEVEVMVRLGEAEMTLREIQQLRPGSIINLDKDTDAMVELVVNDKVIAKGELVVVGTDHFALRITEIESPTERIRTLGP